MKTLLSFIIPCYRSELTIEKVIDEIIDTVSQRAENYDYEIICVNDSSPDNVLSVLKKLAVDNKKIKVIDLAKNVGKHAASMAAFSVSRGSYIVSVDDDCQCPVYDLWKFIEPLENDECDVTTAKYDKKKESAFRVFGSKVNSLMSYLLIGRPKGIQLNNFTVVKQFVMKEIIKYDKPFPYIDGLLYRTTNRIKVIPTHERERGDDKGTGFSLKKCLSLWLNGATAFSVKPLRLSTFIGMFLALIGFACGVVIIVRKLLNPDIAAGYTSSMSMQLFIGGLILTALGFIGEYIGRIYMCLNNSPQYIVRETVNVEQDRTLEKILIK